MLVISGNVSKYEFLTGKDVLVEKNLLEKAAALKRFKYSPLGTNLKAQTGVIKDQYKFFKDQINNAIAKREEKRKEEDEREEYKREEEDEGEIVKKFDTILKDIKN